MNFNKPFEYKAPLEKKKNLSEILKSKFRRWIKLGIILPPLLLATCKEYVDEKDTNTQKNTPDTSKNQIEVYQEELEVPVEIPKEQVAEFLREINEVEQKAIELSKKIDADSTNEYNFLTKFYNENLEFRQWDNDTSNPKLKSFWIEDEKNKENIGISRYKDRIAVEFLEGDSMWSYDLFFEDSTLYKFVSANNKAYEFMPFKLTDSKKLEEKISSFNKNLSVLSNLSEKAIKELDQRNPEPTFILTQEKIDSLVKSNQEYMAQQLSVEKKKRQDQDKGKMTSHDHELLAFGNDSLFNGLSYNDFLNKEGDSLYYMVDPKISFDRFLKLKPAKERELSNEDQPNLSFNPYRYEDTTDINKYFEYKKNQFAHTQEYHLGSTAYALLRTGLYDEWIKAGGKKAEVAKRIIQDINNPVHYAPHPLDTTNTKMTSVGYLDQVTNGEETRLNEYEWLTATWIEMEKRGIKPNFNRGGNGEPLTLKEMDTVNRERFQYTVDHPPLMWSIVDPDKVTSPEEEALKEKKAELNQSACAGSHNLHAMVMFDIHTGDSVQLKKDLSISISKLKEILNDARSNEIGSVGDVAAMHDLSHWLLPLTELPNDFQVDSTTKEIFQRAVKRLVQKGEYFQNKYQSSVTELSTMAHLNDILQHLPKWVLE